MEIKVMIDVTPKVEELVEKLITAFYYGTNTSGFREENTKTQAPIPETEDPKTEEEVKASPTSHEITDDEMKQHMDMCISRFAGNGWRESKDERVLAIRKGCTKAFKEIAKWLGAEKPTALDPEKREEFLKRLGEIFIQEEDGKAPVIEFRPY
ncbi:MAG: hypothetical protein J1F67_05045 [Muribaculaceae bacterium]|nr:hypothetical protein [Muribaculaceae bacterium]